MFANDKRPFDFAISYASENSDAAQTVAAGLRQYDFTVFLDDYYRREGIGVDGEALFESVFSGAHQVVVLVSRHYLVKRWPRFEWDVIKRSPDYLARLIPVRIDDSDLPGLPSSVLYVRYSDDNPGAVITTCITKLIMYCRSRGIDRPSEFEKTLHAIKNESEGATERALQLVLNKKQRKPLADFPVPSGQFSASYRVLDREWCNYSVVRRLSVKMVVPKGLSREELHFNLEHACASEFNKSKPDAMLVLAYADEGDETDLDCAFTAGRIEFGPYGSWGRADEGVAFDLPISQFRPTFKLIPEYFGE
jgi:hypothetical protein